jgi:hypothetical protein
MYNMHNLFDRKSLYNGQLKKNNWCNGMINNNKNGSTMEPYITPWGN